jgi:hypothetical protein
VPIYLRITVNGRRAEMAIHRYIDPEHWNNETGVPRGSKNEIKQLNEYLVLMRSKAYQAQKGLNEDSKPVTSLAIRNIVQGRSEKQHKLLDVFAYHNQLMKEKVTGICYMAFYSVCNNDAGWDNRNAPDRCNVRLDDSEAGSDCRDLCGAFVPFEEPVIYFGESVVYVVTRLNAQSV